MDAYDPNVIGLTTPELLHLFTLSQAIKCEKERTELQGFIDDVNEFTQLQINRVSTDTNEE